MGYRETIRSVTAASGMLDLVVQARDMLDPSWKSEVDRITAQILGQSDPGGWLCGNPLLVESPGLMTGLAGIGYELLRLAAPSQVLSVLALAPPPGR